MTKRLTINSISNAFRLLTYLVIAFFITPFLVHSLGDSIYGLWILIISICGYMGMLDLGVSSAIVRYVSKYHAEKDIEKVNGIVNSALAFFMFMGLMALAIIICIQQWGVSLFNVSPDNYQTINLVLFIMAVNMALFLPGSVMQSILAGFQLYYLINSIGISVMILKNLSIFILLSKGYGIIQLALITLIFNVTEYLLLLLIIWLKRLPVRFRVRFISLPSLKEIFVILLYSSPSLSPILYRIESRSS